MEAKCKCSRHINVPTFLLGLLLSLKLWLQRSTGLERSPNPILPVSPVLFIVTAECEVSWNYIYDIRTGIIGTLPDAQEVLCAACLYPLPVFVFMHSTEVQTLF